MKSYYIKGVVMQTNNRYILLAVRKKTIRLVEIILGVLAFILPRDRKLIIFGAHNGKRFSDNSAYIYNYIYEHEPQLKAVWLSDCEKIIHKLQAQNKIAFKRRSLMGIWLSLRASVIMCSHNIKDAILYIPIKNTPPLIYLHHGIPLRKGWIDSSKATAQQKYSTLQKKKASSYMIAPSIYAAEQQGKMFKVGIDKFKITGLPRNDVLFHDNFEEKKLIIYNSLGIPNDAKILLYAPTWRPWGATTFFPFKERNLKDLNESLLLENVFILIRPHHVDIEHESNIAFWNTISTLSQFKICTHEQVSDINTLCLISCALITDYSSLIFDYLLCDHPIIFVPYDLDQYNDQIGFYMDYDEILVGDKPESWEEFNQSIKDVIKKIDNHSSRRKQLKDKFHKYQDGNSTYRIVEWIKSEII